MMNFTCNGLIHIMQTLFGLVSGSGFKKKTPQKRGTAGLIIGTPSASAIKTRLLLGVKGKRDSNVDHMRPRYWVILICQKDQISVTLWI